MRADPHFLMRAAPIPKAFEAATSAFLTYLRVECGLAANTLDAYARDLRDLTVDLVHQGVLTLKAIGPRDLAQHLASLRSVRGLSSASVARHLASIRMFFRFMQSEGALDEDPTEWLAGLLSHDNIGALLAAPRPTTLPGRPGAGADEAGSSDAAPALPLWLRDRAILELMYACGLRASEVGALRLADRQPTLRVVTVVGKGNKQRMIPFGRPAERALNLYLDRCRPLLLRDDGREKGRLFLSRTGRPLERVAVWQIVKRHAESIGIRGAHPHLLPGGSDLRVVQELLGHSSIVTTQVYTRVDQPRLKDIHKRFHPRA